MRLIKVGCEGYKRFRESTEMDVDEKLIAIVGPNEAGKSSFLEALVALESDEPFADSVRTRGTSLQPAVWARYILEDDDRAALDEIPEARDVRQMIIKKASRSTTRLEPDVERDRGPREAALKLVSRALEHRAIASRGDDDELLAALNASRVALASDEEDLESEEVQALGELVRLLKDVSLPAGLARLPEVALRAHANEAKENPWQTAIRILKNRRPLLLFFSEQSRELRSTYSFDEAPNQALHNFLALAGTSWNELSRAASDPGALEGVMERVRRQLDKTFGAWKQARLIVRLTVQDNVLSVLVRMAARSDYLGIEEHSDGLRQFVALRAHVASNERSDAPPVLLIDEADVHLHYNAQADLVQVLETQDEAAQVIYTTHSAGCLPQDLGRGIRIILPVRRRDGDRIRETDDSKVVNWFWTDEVEGTGFSPILIGMGASALAFASTRLALIAEGASDAILLPTMLREAAGLDRLEYQVAPGLANVDVTAARELDLVAARVAYVLDGDAAGDAKERLLLEAQVPKARILRLGARRKALVLEDLLDKDVYVRAINAQLARWHDGAQLTASDVPNAERPKAVEAWCASRRPKIAPPSKRAVAHRVLDEARERSIVGTTGRRVLRKLHGDATRLLEQPSHAR